MEAFFLIIAVLLQLAFPLLIIFGIIWLVRRSARSRTPSGSSAVVDAIKERDRMWIQYLEDELARTKLKSEKTVLRRLLRDNAHLRGAQSVMQKTVQATVEHGGTKEYVIESTPLPTAPPPVDRAKLDGTILLLYFGAFLFVASAGLFVAFAGINGSIRTLLVLFVTAVMYGAGLWLHRRERLRQAGVAFVSIGMALAPLIGVAAYNFITDQTSGDTIWFITSMMCMALYAHALYVIRSEVIGYVLVFSFLSLFESGAGILKLPTYYFTWAAAAAGLILQFFARRDTTWLELRSSASVSSQFVLPVTLFTSAILVTSQGYAQFGVSLVLATLFYALEAVKGNQEYRSVNLMAAQVSGISALGVGAYALFESGGAVAATLLTAGALHVIGLYRFEVSSEESQNMASIGLLALVAATLFGAKIDSLLLLGGYGSTLFAAMTAVRQRRSDMFWFSGLAATGMSYVVGQAVLSPGASANTQTYLVLPVLVGLFICFMSFKRDAYAQWRNDSAALFVIATFALLVTALFAGAWTFLAASSIVAILQVVMGGGKRLSYWASSSGAVMVAPVLYGIVLNDSPIFFVAVLSALLWNIMVALWRRSELNRWLGAALWLLLPIAFGAGSLNFTMSAAWFGWSYVIVALGLILSRSIARGIIMRSGNIPVASFARNASSSYAVGYLIALAAAVIASLLSADTRLHTTLILLAYVPLLIVLSRVVEQRDDIVIFLPLLLQAVLLSGLRPTSNTGSEMALFQSLGALIAVATYGFCSLLTEGNSAVRFLRNGALYSAYAAPAVAVLYGSSIPWLAAAGLMVAGMLTLYHNRSATQGTRETSTIIIVIGLMWLLLITGVTNVQIYTHLFAVMFAAFAYWRHRLGHEPTVISYLYIMFLSATIPLILQALGGVSGDLYGWWLLLEQVLFMIIGVLIGRRFLTKWGLYVAVAAVIYQLRSLGWAALLVLAVFIIGLSINRLSKLNQR